MNFDPHFLSTHEKGSKKGATIYLAGADWASIKKLAEQRNMRAQSLIEQLIQEFINGDQSAKAEGGK